MKILRSNVLVATLALFGALCIAIGLAGLFNPANKWGPANVIAIVAEALNAPPAVVYFTSADTDNTLSVGGTKTVRFEMDTSVPVNSLGATIDYPMDMLDVVSLSKENSFIDLWTQDTTIKESSGEISFSGGSTHAGGVVGTSTVITITVRAKQAGTATLSVGHLELYAADGQGTAVDTGERSLSLTVTPTAANGSGVGGNGGTITTPPSPDLNGDGKVTILDASIMIAALHAPYNPRYDLNMNGSVGLDDLSILFSAMGH